MLENIVIFEKSFKKKWVACGLDDSDLEGLREQVKKFELGRESKAELLGDLIQGTSGAIKMRFSGNKSNKGKSGSFRLIYCAFALADGNREYRFIHMYPKSIKEDLTQDEKKGIKNVVQDLKENRPN